MRLSEYLTEPSKHCNTIQRALVKRFCEYFIIKNGKKFISYVGQVFIVQQTHSYTPHVCS